VRIGLDAREGFRNQPRGIGLYVRHLLREFAALAPQEEFLLYHERETPPDLPPLAPNQRPVRATIRGGRFQLWERLLIPWRLRRDRVAVYHGTYNTLPPRLWRGPPLVLTLHDVVVTWHDEDRRDPYIRYARKATGRFLRDAAIVLTVSEWSRQDILARYPVAPERVRVFRNGIHPDFLAGAPPGAGDAARARFAGGERYLFAIGAPLPRKNTAGMLRALGLLHARGRLDLAVVVSGLAPEQQARFRDIAAEAGIAARVRFLPYVSREELIGLYAGAELTVYPSFAEGFGIPIVESLSVGTPVAASRTTAMPEAGGEFATYFDPHQPEEIAAQVEHALAARVDWPSRRDAAVAHARRFTWRRAAEVTLAAYREAAG
jgi:glycosyltransferase involved in cell wall biosynthesis